MILLSKLFAFVLGLGIILATDSSIVQAQDVYYCQKCGKYHARQQAQVARTGSISVTASWGSGPALQVAIASAQYRAMNRIKGHSPIDLQSGRRNGVGWATHDPSPPTCFWGERNRGAYASVRGPDGQYYSTLVF